MKTIPRFIACTLVATWTFSTPARSGGLYIIANTQMDLQMQDVREIFLGNKEYCGETRVVPIDNESAKAEFLGDVLGVDKGRYENIWIKRAFRDALDPPATELSDAAVVAFVKRTRGAIGYVRTPPGAEVVVITTR